jgi:hypothetical protein
MFINAISPVEGLFTPVMAGWLGVALIIIILLLFGRGMAALCSYQGCSISLSLGLPRLSIQA